MFVSVFAEHGIKQISFSIYCSIQVTPFATYLDIRLVQIPGMTSNSTTFTMKILTDQRSKSILPDTYRFVTYSKPSLQQKLGNISESELVSQTPEHSKQDNISGELEIVERRAGSFVETSIAVTAVESSISK
jgi:hypothetical protein